MATRKNATNQGPAAKRQKVGNKYQKPEPIPLGSVLTDNQRGQWKVGPSVGTGGFGEIYAAYSLAEPIPKYFATYPYVVKIEPHENGPLFVEKTFYMKNCQLKDIQNHMKRFKLKHLGIPRFVSSGTHLLHKIKHRFLVLPRYGESLQSVFLRYERCLPLQTVYRVALQTLDALEYIHLCGYVHADVKASNILYTDMNYDKIFLVDFGLATKYDAPEVFKPDPKKKHNGTIEYTSRDAHQGVSTMRGDLEVLAYNLIEWAGGKLPWNEEKILKDCDKVQHMKETALGSETPEEFLKRCFSKSKVVPKPLADFIKLVTKLRHNATPNYSSCSQLFEKALKQLGFSKVGGMGLKAANQPPDTPSTSGALVQKKTAKRKNVAATPQEEPLPDTVPNTPEDSPSTSPTSQSTRSGAQSVASSSPMPGSTISKSFSGVSVQIQTPKKSGRGGVSGVPENANFSPRVVLVKIGIESNVHVNVKTTRNARKKTATISSQATAASITSGRTTRRGNAQRNVCKSSSGEDGPSCSTRPARTTKNQRSMRELSSSEESADEPMYKGELSPSDGIRLHLSSSDDEGDISKSVFD